MPQLAASNPSDNPPLTSPVLPAGPGAATLPNPSEGAAGVGRPGGPVGSSGFNAFVMIAKFKHATVVLYDGESANAGERVAASDLPLPLRSRPASSNANRLQIDTASGPRWLSRGEVVLAAAAQTLPAVP